MHVYFVGSRHSCWSLTLWVSLCFDLLQLLLNPDVLTCLTYRLQSDPVPGPALYEATQAYPLSSLLPVTKVALEPAD